MQKTIILLIIGSIIATGFLSGCNENTQKNNQPNANDVAFLNWTKTNLDTASTMLGTIQSFMNSGNDSVQVAALYADENKPYLNNISAKVNTFQVSSSYQMLQSEFVAFLQDITLAIDYLDEGADTSDQGILDQATSSLASAKSHADECVNIIAALEG
jgi:hypothetical protein